MQRHKPLLSLTLVLATATSAACSTDSTGGAPVLDTYRAGTARSWFEGDQMLTEIRDASSDATVIARAEWDIEAGAGIVEIADQSMPVAVPAIGEWTEHEANDFTYRVWEETEALIERPTIDEFTAGTRPTSDEPCQILWDGWACHVFISCSICVATDYGEDCQVLGSGPIPILPCLDA